MEPIPLTCRHHYHHHHHHRPDLAPDVVAVEVAALEVAEGWHVLVDDVHLEVSSGLDTGGHVPGLGAQLQNLQALDIIYLKIRKYI